MLYATQNHIEKYLKLSSRPQLFEEWILLSIRYISVHLIVQCVLLTLMHLITSYPLDSFILPLNNWALMYKWLIWELKYFKWSIALWYFQTNLIVFFVGICWTAGCFVTRLITVMTYNVHGFFLAAFIFHRKLKSWTEKKKKKIASKSYLLYTGLCSFWVKHQFSQPRWQKGPPCNHLTIKKRNGPITWGGSSSK